MNIGQIIDAKGLLDKIASNDSLPTRTSYKIYLMLNKLNASLEFYNTRRMELFREYGEEEGENIIIPKDKVAEFEPKLQELLDLDVEEEITPVDVSLDVDLGIAPVEFGLLTPFINFVE